MTRPFIVRLVDDVSSVHLQYDFESKTPTKVARTKTLNSLIAISDVVQFQSVQLIYTIFRVIQTQHNRSQQVYQELINMLTPNLFKIIQNVPDDNGFYTYHIMVQQQVLSILKIILRPRLEEQHDIVAKLTTRLTFEFD